MNDESSSSSSDNQLKIKTTEKSESETQSESDSTENKKEIKAKLKEDQYQDIVIPVDRYWPEKENKEEIITRKSTREHKKPEIFGKVKMCNALQWIESTQKELDSLISMQTWEIVDKQKDIPTISVRW